MIKLVAFDWNGTILSDTNPVLRAENAVRKAFGLKPSTLQEFQNEFDVPIKKYWVAAGFDSEVFDREADNIQRIFMATYEPMESKSRTRSGTREILNWLMENNIKACIFSNHPQGHIEKQSVRLGFEKYLSTILGRDQKNSHLHKRSKGEKLNAFVNTLQLKPTEVVTVGDTIEEIEIAKNYGYTSVAITGGYNSVRRLKAANPDYLIDNLVDLKKIIV